VGVSALHAKSIAHRIASGDLMMKIKHYDAESLLYAGARCSNSG
jgi:hypothetical protein